jgi:palmitoyl-protein thioesterase
VCRHACGTGEPNTCGPCLHDLHSVDSTWVPFEDDFEHGNEPCELPVFRPVVMIHGLGDTYQGSLSVIAASMSRDLFPNLRTFSAEPGGFIFSMAKPFEIMVMDFAKEIREIPSLKKGFNLVGFSQGGLIARAYIEKYNDPPVFNFISFHAPQMGISHCPGLFVQSIPCEYAVHWGLLTVKDYWRGVDENGEFSKDSYLSWKSSLQDINNEGEMINKTYRENLISVNRYVLVKAERDQVVLPPESEWHGYHPWGEMSKVLTMLETDDFKEDRIGLKTLYDNQRMVMIKTSGGHLQFNRDFWSEYIMPFFHNGWIEGSSKPFDLEHEFRSKASKGHH